MVMTGLSASFALAEFLPSELSARTERLELGFCNIAMHWGHAAIRRRGDSVFRYEFHDSLDDLYDILRRLDGVAGDIDHAGLHDLAG